MDCEFHRFHYKEDNKFDFSFIYGDTRIGVVHFKVRDEAYFCIDMLNLQNHQQMHMDRYIFEKCINRLTALTTPDIFFPTIIDSDLHIKQIPFTNTYKVVYKNQKIIFDINAIEALVEIWSWIHFTLY